MHAYTMCYSVEYSTAFLVLSVPRCSDWVRGSAGSNVSLTLYFIRFAMGMNLVLLLIWAALALGPFLLQAPPTFRWNQIQDYSIASVLQGYGMDNSFLLYGEFSATCGLLG